MKTIKICPSTGSRKRDFIFMLLTFVVTGCLDPEGQVKPDPNDHDKVKTLDINFYIPSENVGEIEVPQITLKSDNVQITSIGNNSNGIQGDINKMYISDTETQTEWIVLIDGTGPQFLYAINSSTREKLPFLCWMDKQDDSRYTLRVYDYDWLNQLGTLQYEAVVNGDNISAVFENEHSPENSRISQVGDAENRKPTTPVAPIGEFEKYTSESNRKNEDSVVNEGVVNEQFEPQVKEMIAIIRETKAKLIAAPCTVSKILDRSDQKLVCKLSDQINAIAHEDVLNDLSQAANQTPTPDTLKLDRSNTQVNIDFFRHSEITKFIDRHLNNVRNIFSEYVDFKEWATGLREFNNVRSEKLDNLSDANGILQISLSWNTTSDIDLHVTDPFHEEIYSQNPSSSSGGYLDLEDSDGFGPESIYWTQDVPDGTYSVSVVYQDGVFGQHTEYTVKISNGLGAQRVFSGSVGFFDRKVLVGSFTKKGKEIL